MGTRLCFWGSVPPEGGTPGPIAFRRWQWDAPDPGPPGAPRYISLYPTLPPPHEFPHGEPLPRPVATDTSRRSLWGRGGGLGSAQLPSPLLTG